MATVKVKFYSWLVPPEKTLKLFGRIIKHIISHQKFFYFLVKDVKFVLAVGFVVLAGCGGNGVNPVTLPSKYYPVSQSFLNTYSHELPEKSFRADGVGTGRSEDFPFDGIVTGILSVSYLPATSANFEGVYGYQITTIIKGNVSAYNRSIAINLTYTDYRNSNNQLIGKVGPGKYCVAESPGSYPTTIDANQGGVGTIVRYICYSDNTKLTVTGREELTFEAHDSIVRRLTFITYERIFNPDGVIMNSNTNSYTISSSGELAIDDLSFNATLEGHNLFFFLH